MSFRGQIGDGSSLIIHISIVVSEIRRSSVCSRAWVLVLIGFLLELHHTMLFIKDAFAPSLRVSQSIVAAV